MREQTLKWCALNRFRHPTTALHRISPSATCTYSAVVPTWLFCRGKALRCFCFCFARALQSISYRNLEVGSGTIRCDKWRTPGVNAAVPTVGAIKRKPAIMAMHLFGAAAALQ